MIFLPALILGFGGSLHCMAMCGPLVMYMKFGKQNSWRTYGNMAVYHLGRILTYALLGGIAGALGWAVSLGNYHQWLSLIMGGFILISGLLSFTGWIMLPGLNTRWFSKGMEKLKKLPKSLSLFVMGGLNGLLPCGLVYVAIGTSVVTASPLEAAFFMAIFGLGTTPLLTSLPVLQRMLQKEFKGRTILRINWKGVLAIIAGLLLIVRGLNLNIPYVSPGTVEKAGTTEYFCH